MTNNNNKRKQTYKEEIGLADPQLTSLKKTHGEYGRKAVLFGIDKYMIEGANLQGCVNDVYDMANTLLALGWPKTGIHVITNERATSDRWFKEMQWLTENTGPGDVRILMHSSHGTNKWDYSGDEPDQRDEMVVMHNFSWDDETTHITDDHIRERFTQKLHKECKGEVILDTCHSGTGARSIRFGGYDTRVKYLPNPEQQTTILNRTLPINEKRKWFGNSNVDREIAGDATYNNGTIYACQDFDLAYETAILVNGQYQVRGLMTYNLCNILRETPYGAITRKELGEELRARVALESPQVPGYECSNETFYNQYPFRRAHQDEPGEM